MSRLEIIAGIFDYWRDFNTKDRAKEGLETRPDTHLVCCPPTWPSHGVLENWSKALREADAEIERLRDVLRFYADPFSARDEYGERYAIPDFYSETDFGDRARAALPHP